MDKELAEKSVAEVLGGKPTIASGALWFQKADVRTPDLLVECKTTEKDYYIFKSKLWEKLKKEADRDKIKIPVFVIDFHNYINKERVFVFSPQDFDIKVKKSDFDYFYGDDDICKDRKSVRLRMCGRYDICLFNLKHSEYGKLPIAPEHYLAYTDEYTFIHQVYK